MRVGKSYSPVLRSLLRSRKWNGCSAGARELYIRLLLGVDDAGRHSSDPMLLRGALAPLCPEYTEGAVAGWLAELSDAGLVHLYEHDGEPLLALVDYFAVLRKDRPAKVMHPDPDGQVTTTWQPPVPNGLPPVPNGKPLVLTAPEQNKNCASPKEEETASAAQEGRLGTVGLPVATNGSHLSPPTPTPTPTPTPIPEGRKRPAPAAPVWEQALVERGLEGRGFEPACERWAAFRREARKKAWPKTTWKASLTKLGEDPEAYAQAVDESISNGWDGLFAPKRQGPRSRRDEGNARFDAYAETLDSEALLREAFGQGGAA